MEYFPNSNNILISCLHLGLEFFTNNFELIIVLFCRFYSFQSLHGHILRSLEANFDLLEIQVCILSELAFIFYLIPLPGKTLICLRLHLFVSAFTQRVSPLISQAIYTALYSISAFLQQVTRLTSAYFSSIPAIFSDIFV